MDIEAFRVAVEAIAGVFNGNAGGFVLSWLIMLGLIFALWRSQVARDTERAAELDAIRKGLRECQQQHKECEDGKQRLAFGLLCAINGRIDEARAIVDDILPRRRAGDHKPPSTAGGVPESLL